MRSALLTLVAAAIAAVAIALVGATTATAATLTYATAGTGTSATGTLTYTGTDAPETVTIESITAGGVKFFHMTAGQIAPPLPSGCSAQPAAAGTQIVSCTITGLTDVTVQAAGGNDTIEEAGLSKPSLVRGGAGDDRLTGGSAADTIYGDGGVDTIASGPAVDSIYVRDGLADTVDCGGALDNLQGDTTDVYNGCETRDLSADLVPDADGDGFKPPADCDDAHADIHPGVFDVPGDGIDQDCDGKDAFVSTSGTGSGSTGGTTGGGSTGTGTGTTGTTKATPAPTPAPAAPATPALQPAAGSATPTPTAAPAASVVGSQVNAGATGAPRVTAVPHITFALLAARRSKRSTGSTSSTTAGGLASSKTGGMAAAARLTRATKVVVDLVPAGATVRVRCKGGAAVGCPTTRYKKTFQTGALHLVVRSLFASARLRPGARLEVRVTLPGAVGLSTRYRVNARSRPDAETRCLAPGTDAPIAC
jgi:hypothetical protein